MSGWVSVGFVGKYSGDDVDTGNGSKIEWMGAVSRKIHRSVGLRVGGSDSWRVGGSQASYFQAGQGR